MFNVRISHGLKFLFISLIVYFFMANKIAFAEDDLARRKMQSRNQPNNSAKEAIVLEKQGQELAGEETELKGSSDESLQTVLSKDRPMPEYEPDVVLIKFKQDIGEAGLLEGPLQDLIVDYSIESIEPVFKGLHEKMTMTGKTEIELAQETKARFSKYYKESAAEETINYDPKLRNIYKIQLQKGSNVNAAIAQLRKSQDIEYAEPNYFAKIHVFPQDPDFLNQWGLHNTEDNLGTPDADIDAPEAWDIAQGSEDIIIAIVDTGVDYDHPDLEANIWINDVELNGVPDVDDDNNGYIDDIRGYNFLTCAEFNTQTGECDVLRDPDNDPMDDHGHGTHCSGIAAAVTDNNVGVAGVCWNCKIMAIKSFNYQGWGTHEDAANALYYAVENEADIISNSWGGPRSQVKDDAINYVTQYSIVIAAAGNNKSYWNKTYPAAYDNVVSVGASDYNDARASFSNYAHYDDYWIDTAAPGLGIYSTLWNDAYGYMNGTSMATPFVAGLAGLVKTHNPGWDDGLVIGQILSTGDDVIYPLGVGRINAYKALTDSPQTPNIVFKKFVIDDSLGDKDGYLDPGETINLVVTLRNNLLPATNVEAELSTLDPDVTVTSSVANFGDLSTMESSTSEFSIALDSSAGRSRFIAFEMNVVDDSGYNEVIAIQVEVPYEFQEGWPVISENKSTFTTPTLGDIDGDGDLEVAMGNDGYISAYHHDGNYVQGWPVNISPYSSSIVSMVDIDDDGKEEIFASSRIPFTYSIRMWGIDNDGSNLSGWPVDIEVYVGEPLPSVGDIDGDGDYEILIAMSSYIYAWHHDGTSVAGFDPKEIAGESLAQRLCLADIDNDGDLEIFVIGRKIFGFHHDGSDVSGFPVDPVYYGPNFYASVVVGDLDKDGELEIIASLQDLIVIDAYGNILWKMENPNYANYHKNPVIGDLDGDGDLEIITVFEDPGSHGSNELYVYHHDGTLMEGGIWPIQRGKSKSSAAVIGDIDSDGEVEIITASGNNVESYNADGTMIDDFPILGYGSGNPILGDIDDDGDVEIAVTSGARAFIFDSDGAHSSLKMLWPTYHHDSKHSGCYNAPLELAYIGNKSVNPEKTLAFRIRATDPEGFKIEYSAHNLPRGASFNPTTRQFSWTPTWSQLGRHTVLFKANDGYFTDSEVVEIVVRRPVKNLPRIMVEFEGLSR